ncbi:MAG: ParB/RepB/Spo0J family partition protein [Zetaproteobacteria bacterium]|nr:MAG: ParB/RepB/Spo0J family partition protein [Zetaproteobacteria bacterium]
MAARNKRGLGRGLSALFSDEPNKELMQQANPIAISSIKPNRYQPRKRFSTEQLKTLTESIRRDGVLTPILVRPMGNGYELIAGERRWRAAQAAGLVEIPAVVREVDDLQALEFAIVENEQRDDLTAIESARAYQRMIEEFGCTQQQVAERIGVSRVQVSNTIRLLQLPESIQAMVEKRELSMGQARPLVGLERAVAEELARACVEQGWSARQMEKAAKRAQTSKRAKREPDADVLALQEELQRKLGLPVLLTYRKDGSGTLKISYSRPDELDGVLRKLRS